MYKGERSTCLQVLLFQLALSDYFCQQTITFRSIWSPDSYVSAYSGHHPLEQYFLTVFFAPLGSLFRPFSLNCPSSPMRFYTTGIMYIYLCAVALLKNVSHCNKFSCLSSPEELNFGPLGVLLLLLRLYTLKD